MTDKTQSDALDNEDDVLDEAHDTENADKQAIAANNKSQGATKQAATRGKADKRNHDPMPKSKAGLVAVAHELMSEMTADQVASFVSQMVEGDAVVENRTVPGNFDLSTDLTALVESEATLSEEFKTKAAVLFETAVNVRLAEELDRLETSYATELEEEVKTIRSDLVESVDNYLNYVVESWMEENKLAVETGLRTEIAETFIGKLKDLFTESYIEVPESKVDLVDELATENEELEEALNSTTAKNLRLMEEVQDLKRKDVIREATKDLADTQATKLASLVEQVTFDDEESFAAKVKIIKESHFTTKPSTPSSADQLSEDTDNAEEISPQMAAYLTALRKTSQQ